MPADGAAAAQRTDEACAGLRVLEELLKHPLEVPSVEDERAIEALNAG
jgi:hypothetical protein